MRRWINFSDRLPARTDADAAGNVELLDTKGGSRTGLWNWVPTVDHWHANGFAAWRPIATADSSKRGTS